MDRPNVARTSLPWPVPVAVVTCISFTAIAVKFNAPGVAAVPMLVGIFFVAQPLMDRGRVRSIEMRDDSIVFTTLDGQRSIPRSAVGSVGVTGPVILDHLHMPWGIRPQLVDSARVVVHDPHGAVLVALRATWFRQSQLEHTAVLAGVPWAGHLTLGNTPIAPLLQGSTNEPPDHATLASTLRTMRRHSWKVLGTYSAALAAFVLGRLAAETVGAPDVVTDVLGTIVFIGSLIGIAVLFTQPLRSNTPRSCGRIIRSSPAGPVEVVVLRGAPDDPGRRFVVVVGDRPGVVTSTWLIDSGGERGWLQEFDRQSCLLVRARRGPTAVLASSDCQHLALLKESEFGRPTASFEWASQQVADRAR